MKLWQAFTAGALYLSSMTAQADILFLNVNNSGKEIDAAQKAAAVRGEKLIVLPVQKADPKKVAALQAKMLKLQDRFFQECQSRDERKSEGCQTQRKALMQAKSEVRELRSELNPKVLDAELAKLKNSGVKLTSLVVSGHDGNGHFGGENGYLDDQSIARAFANNAPIGDSIRSMMMWGCYTSNIGSLNNSWKKTLPNVELIAGYDGIAPLADKPANWQYLTDVLIKEKKLTAIKDANELKKALNGLDGTNLLNASICVNDNFASHKLTLNLRDAAKLCDGAIQSIEPIYACYLNATEPRCANPPDNTGNSELRDTYNKLQDARHCLEVNPEALSKLKTIPSPDVLIRLIYFKNIKANFTEAYPNYIPRVNELLKTVGAPDELQIGDISKMSRADILKKLNALNDYLAINIKTAGPLTPEMTSLLTGVSGLQGVLGNLGVPFSWVEPSAHQKLPVADFIEKNMSKEGIAQNRQMYETNRAGADLNNKVEELMTSKSPQYKEAIEKSQNLAKSLTAASQANQKLTQEQVAEQGKKYQEYFQSISTAGEIKQRELSSNSELKTALKAAVKDLSEKPYPNAEGQKVYQKNLEAFAENPAKIPVGGFGSVTLGGGIGSGMIMPVATDDTPIQWPQTTQGR